MDEFELELKKGFLQEAGQLLEDCEQTFLSLENNKGDQSVLDSLFRLAHNLKGSSRGVGFGKMAELTHELENLLLKLKKNELPILDSTVDLLLECNDFLKGMIVGLTENLEKDFDIAPLVEKIQRQIQGGPAPVPAEVEAQPEPESQPEPALEPAPEPEAVAPAQIFEPEPVMAEPTAAPPAPVASPEPPSPQANSSNGGSARAAANVDDTIRVPLFRIQKLNDFVGEIIIMQSVLSQSVTDESLELRQKTIAQMAKITKEIQEISMSMRMLPVKATFQKMNRIVRDTSKLLNKEVNLTLKGEDTEVDKTILEQLNDPLVHAVRNAVDHGLESTEERLNVGKGAAGNVSLKAFHEANQLVIEVEDDGKGMDPAKIVAKAKEKKVIPQDAVLDKESALKLIFHPGFSTKSEVSEVSGRGVGLDVVKSNIEKLGGSVQVLSELGKGSLFRIVVPLTTAIIDGMVTLVGEERYIVPVSQVAETVQPKEQDFGTITGGGEVLNLRGETLPVFHLGNALKRNQKTKATKNCIAIVCRTRSNEPRAFLVDDILRQQQVVIKTLGPEIRQKHGLVGSAILGDGKPSIIVDLFELSKVAS